MQKKISANNSNQTTNIKYIIDLCAHDHDIDDDIVDNDNDTDVDDNHGDDDNNNPYVAEGCGGSGLSPALQMSHHSHVHRFYQR